jgi:hypothetical protein
MLVGPLFEEEARISDHPCEDCGTYINVNLTICPYADDVYGEEVEVYLCEECEAERAMDI